MSLELVIVLKVDAKMERIIFYQFFLFLPFVGVSFVSDRDHIQSKFQVRWTISLEATSQKFSFIFVLHIHYALPESMQNCFLSLFVLSPTKNIIAATSNV